MVLWLKSGAKRPFFLRIFNVFNQNPTMKNTRQGGQGGSPMRTPQKIGADVRPIEGVWGADRSAPREGRRALAPEHGTRRPRPPGETKNVAQVAGTRGGGAGGKPRKPAREGKPLHPRRAKQGASRKKPPEGHRCADRRESPRRGVPPGAPAAPGAGARQGQRRNAAKSPRDRTTKALRRTAMGAGKAPPPNK